MEYHCDALQWLLRRQYLEAMGIDGSAATNLVANARSYKSEYAAAKDYYESSRSPSC